jgi:hypothetical protein
MREIGDWENGKPAVTLANGGSFDGWDAVEIRSSQLFRR